MDFKEGEQAGGLDFLPQVAVSLRQTTITKTGHLGGMGKYRTQEDHQISTVRPLLRRSRALLRGASKWWRDRRESEAEGSYTVEKDGTGDSPAVRNRQM